MWKVSESGDDSIFASQFFPQMISSRRKKNSTNNFTSGIIIFGTFQIEDFSWQ